MDLESLDGLHPDVRPFVAPLFLVLCGLLSCSEHSVLLSGRASRVVGYPGRCLDAVLCCNRRYFPPEERSSRAPANAGLPSVSE